MMSALGGADDGEKLSFTAARDRLRALAGELAHWIEQQTPDDVYWVESSTTRYGRKVSLAAAPIDVGPVLREHLFAKTRCVVLTSATLAIGRPPAFDFFKSRLGLTSGDTLRAGSPFNYREQAQLILVRGLPDPSLEDVEKRIQAGYLLCGTPDEVNEQIKKYEEVGADQIVFGLPVDMPLDAAIESVELFGKHVLPNYDKDPVHRSTRFRDAAAS